MTATPLLRAERGFAPAEPPPDLADREIHAPDNFEACLDAHGKYETMRFTLRLSPRNHRLIEAIAAGDYAGGDLPDEAILAYATYLHETVHWWQHVGSTAGLLYSLAYPAQLHANLSHLKAVVRAVGPKKSLLSWAEAAALAGTPPTDVTLRHANIVVNNTLDVDFYKAFTAQPMRADELFAHRYFESVGHAYYMAYGQLTALLGLTLDETGEHLPDTTGWDAEIKALADAKVVNYHHGSAIIRSRVGLHAIFEGQARFIQLQFLSNAALHPPSCADWRAAGYLSGVYVEAFDEFLRLSESDWPETISDPLVGLFLLICDVAINPTRGFPHPIEAFRHFVEDVDPGMRFTNLCRAVKEMPDVRSAIRSYSREEYIDVAGKLTAMCSYDDPLFGAQTIARYPAVAPGAAALMREHQTFEYAAENLPVRVLVSHFISFAQDRLDHPELFCWPGVWMAGDRGSADLQQVFVRHLSLFADRAEDRAIYPRMQPGRTKEAVLSTFNIFFGQTLLYDLSRQWILRDGPFQFDYDWLTAMNPGTLEAWASSAFEKQFGVHPKDFSSSRA